MEQLTTRQKTILLHMMQAGNQHLTVWEKRDRVRIGLWIFVSAALWALIIVPFAL